MEDQDSPLTIVLRSKSKLCLRDIIVERRNADSEVVALDLKTLCIFDGKSTREGTLLPLTMASSNRWEVVGLLHVPSDAGTIDLVVSCEEGGDIGFIHFESLAELNLDEAPAKEMQVKVPESMLHLTITWNLVEIPGEDRVASVEEMLSRVNPISLQAHAMTGDASGVEELVSAIRKLLHDTQGNHPTFPNRLYALSLLLRGRFDRTENMADINEAISTLQRAVDLTPEHHPTLPSILINLGYALFRRYESLEDTDDLSSAICASKKGMGLIAPSEHGADFRAALGCMLVRHVEKSGDTDELSEGLSLLRGAAHATDDSDPAVPRRLTSIGIAFQRHYDRTGDLALLDEAITILKRALVLIPDGDAKATLSTLGNCFGSRFIHSGDLKDAAEAVFAFQKALIITPEGNAGFPSLLSDLSGVLTARFHRTGDLSDITEAISAGEKSILCCPDKHPKRRLWLSSLGKSLHSRFAHGGSGDLADIDRAIEVHGEAVALTTEQDVWFPAYSNNLANSFRIRFRHTGDATDLVWAIGALRRAVNETPQGHPEIPLCMYNLGISLRLFFAIDRSADTLRLSVSTLEKALILIPKGHAAVPTILFDLGLTISQRCFLNPHGRDLDTARYYFRMGAECGCGSPKQRLQAADAWAQLINKSRYLPSEALGGVVIQPSEVLAAFDTQIRLVTLVAGLEDTIGVRHKHIEEISGKVPEAAAAACELEFPDKAVEWLEQGRCLVWTQLSHLRTPLYDLRIRNAHLAQQIADVSKLLETAASTRGTGSIGSTMAEKIAVEGAARDHLDLSREWDDLLKKARDITGFESFLQPSSFESLLQGLPESGPVVIVNVHRERCDAIALLAGSGEAVVISLPDFTLEKAKKYRRNLTAHLKLQGLRMHRAEDGVDTENRANMEDEVDAEDGDRTGGFYRRKRVPGKNVTRGVLRCLWEEIVKPVLNALGFQKRGDEKPRERLPRIWWCPTGPLSFLPIHAAGAYDAGESDSLLDYAVSSYTPTVTSLIKRVQGDSPVDKAVSGIFLTSQPKPRGARQIQGTTKEVNSVYATALKHGVRALKREGDETDADGCLSLMEDYSSVHLACHGSQDASEPLQSRFLFHKGRLTLGEILQKNLQNADLAFLSACETGTGEETLPDEAVHLAAGMLAAGYRRVVATMWAIGDRHAPDVANDFYEYLFAHMTDDGGGRFDASLSAHALHYAIQKLRHRLADDSEESLLAWVPYVHFGY